MNWFTVAAIACSGCATSYTAATSQRSLGNGMYVITADGNGFTSRSTINDYMYRRAAELCAVGFDLVDADRSTNSTLATFDGGKTYTTVNTPSGSLAIQCRSPGRLRERRSSPDATAPPVTRKVVKGERPIYCTASAVAPDLGFCSLAAETCAAAYTSLTADGSAYTACTPSRAAACFNAVQVLSEERVTRCSPTITGCEADLARLRSNPDYVVKAAECGVYRVTAGASATDAPASSPQ